MTNPCRQILCALCLFVVPLLQAQDALIAPNDNLETAGRTDANTLTLDLVAEQGMWYPGGEGKPGTRMQALREVGGPLLAPGPMLRAEVGTEVVATIRNSIPDTALYLEGLQARADGVLQPLRIPAGESRTVRFVLDEVGVFLYWGATSGESLIERPGVESLLSGVIVVDPPGTTIAGRFLMLGEQLLPELGKREHTINGRSFPNTEHMQVVVGEPNTWHVLNTTLGAHPMHLHGTFFQVSHRGNVLEYTETIVANRRDEVTVKILPGEVATMQWHTDRIGNWLFHCHISAHVAADPGRLSSGDDFVVDHAAPGLHEMAGMTLAITATERTPSATPPPISPRELTMRLQPMANYFGDNTGYAIAINSAGSAANMAVAPGPMLVLTQDEAVSIELINELPESTAIHWHGMELESYYDGVAGFSGTIGSVTPVIEPGENFVVRMTPPRAGTYIYHTHKDDIAQLARGLYGALIVQSPEYPYDPAIDKVLVMGLAGDAVRTRARIEGMVINGSRDLQLDLQEQQEYRLRLINISANNSSLRVTLRSAAGVQQWTLVSKDGARIQDHQHAVETARNQPISVGETYDFAWTPPATGDYWLEVDDYEDVRLTQVLLRVAD